MIGLDAPDDPADDTEIRHVPRVPFLVFPEVTDYHHPSFTICPAAPPISPSRFAKVRRGDVNSIRDKRTKQITTYIK